MKNKLCFLSFVSLLVVLNFISCEKETSNFADFKNHLNSNPLTDSIYAFPVKPGMEIWTGFETHEEKIKSCQIPDNVLKNLPTTGLIKSCLDYPLLMDLFAYDNLQDGLDALVINFNGFQELLKRKDAPEKILNFYKSIDPAIIECDNDIGLFSFKLMTIEMLLSKDKILNQITESEKNDLLSLCIEKHSVMDQNPDVYGLYSCISQSLVIYRVLDIISPMKLKNANTELGVFVQKGNMPFNQDILLESYVLADNYLNSIGHPVEVSNLKSASITCSKSIGTVKTPKGSYVTVYTFGCEPLSSSQITSLNNQYKKMYPKAVLLSSASGKYNCHSYAWYSQSTSNYRWMDYPSVYWTDGSYSMVNYCAPNLVWTYSSPSTPSTPSHSAIAISYNGLPLRSKWGSAPLFAHGYYDCPYSGTLRSYRRN